MFGQRLVELLKYFCGIHWLKSEDICIIELIAHPKIWNSVVSINERLLGTSEPSGSGQLARPPRPEHPPQLPNRRCGAVQWRVGEQHVSDRTAAPEGPWRDQQERGPLRGVVRTAHREKGCQRSTILGAARVAASRAPASRAVSRLSARSPSLARNASKVASTTLAPRTCSPARKHEPRLGRRSTDGLGSGVVGGFARSVEDCNAILLLRPRSVRQRPRVEGLVRRSLRSPLQDCIRRRSFGHRDCEPGSWWRPAQRSRPCLARGRGSARRRWCSWRRPLPPRPSPDPPPQSDRATASYVVGETTKPLVGGMAAGAEVEIHQRDAHDSSLGPPPELSQAECRAHVGCFRSAERAHLTRRTEPPRGEMTLRRSGGGCRLTGHDVPMLDGADGRDDLDGIGGGGCVRSM